MKKVGLIGYGAIGQAIAGSLSTDPCTGVRLAAVLLRPNQVRAAESSLGPIGLTDDLVKLLEYELDIVVEAAGHQSVVDHGEAILGAGCDFYILSTGALAYDDVLSRLIAAAERGGSNIVIPAGALAGIDGLLAMRASGLKQVTYVSSKPPHAWLETPAAKDHDLHNLKEQTILFEGSARDAARLFPKNANLAATVAFAGLGLDRTQVRLIANPTSMENEGTIIAEGTFAKLVTTLAGSGTSQNPKTSEITAYSVLAALQNTNSNLRFF